MTEEIAEETVYPYTTEAGVVVTHREEFTPEITLEDLAGRLDALGAQMDWLCENLASLFAFVNQMSGSGGGIMGVMKALKNGAPEMSQQPEKVGINE